MEERKELGLLGILPPYVQTIEEQAEQAYQHFLRKPSNLEKRHFLMEIFNTNRTLFYYLSTNTSLNLTQSCMTQLSLKQLKNIANCMLTHNTLLTLILITQKTIRRNTKKMLLVTVTFV